MTPATTTGAARVDPDPTADLVPGPASLTPTSSGAGEAGPPWHTLAKGGPVTGASAPVHPRRVFVQIFAGVLAVLILVGVLGSLAARRLSEREAVNDAANTAGVLAVAVVQPALTDALIGGDPLALQAFDIMVREKVMGPGVVRVKLWSPQGEVLYADEPQLIGQVFPLSADQESALRDTATQAEISRLNESENTFETGDRLVEVYRPVWFPNGSVALFEMYTSYDSVGARSSQLWRGFAGVTLSSLILLLVLVAPIVWHLISRLRGAERQRAALLERSVEASADERRLIAATLHDGPVQELAATSFAVAGASARAQSIGDRSLAHDLDAAAASVRSSIRSLRTLLVDIYPASLARSGLAAALADLAQGVRRGDITVQLDVAPDAELRLSAGRERAAYRVAQECLRNAVQHAGPATVAISLYREGDTAILDVVDDGAGFDVKQVLDHPEDGHFGLRLLADAASLSGSLMQVSSASGYGTHWRLTMDVGPAGDA